MSRIKEEYQKQIDAFCEKNNTISAQDIWNKAQNRTPSEEKVVEFKPRKSKGMVWKAAIPAIICFLLVSTTTVTATGYLSDLSGWFRNLFKDEKTAEIIDAGYYQDMNMVVSDENFEVRIVGVSGDTNNTQVALDILVKDETLINGRDKIYLEAYCMSIEEYENNLDNYGTWEGQGVRDENVENLYHVKLRTGLWISNGEETVLEIVKIQFAGDGKPWRTKEVSLKYTLQVDSSVFYQMKQHYADFAPFKYKDTTYSLSHVNSGYYYTEIAFYNMDAETPSEEEMETYCCKKEEYEEWREFVQRLILVVDGVEYKVIPGEENRPWYETYDGGFTHMHPYFPAFIYDEVTSVEIRFGDIVYKVK